MAWNNTELTAIVSEAAADVLETMFYTSLAGEPETSGEAPGGMVAAGLRFRGAPSGEFQLALSPDAAESMAADFLGDQPGAGGTQTGEVICELANMLCGAVLSRLESDACFELEHPERIAGVSPSAPSALCLRFPLDSGMLMVSLALEGAALG